MVDVGKYTSPMDPMGIQVDERFDHSVVFQKIKEFENTHVDEYQEGFEDAKT